MKTRNIFTSITMSMCVAFLLTLGAQNVFAQQEQQKMQGQQYQTREGMPVQQESGATHLYISQAGIRRVQEALNKNGFSSGATDGILGKNTRKAIMDFQKAQGMEPTGKLNLETLQTLVGSVNIEPMGWHRAGEQPGKTRAYYGKQKEQQGQPGQSGMQKQGGQSGMEQQQQKQGGQSGSQQNMQKE